MTAHTEDSGRQNFYLLMPDISAPVDVGVRIENIKNLLQPPRRVLRPADGGFPPMQEMPRLVFDPNEGAMPRDLEGGFSGYWLVSERLRAVMAAVDPEGFDFRACEFRLPDGSPGPLHHLCEVTRTLDALDESASRLDIEISDEFALGKYYDFTGGASLRFLEEKIGDAAIFGLMYTGDDVFCRRRLLDSVRSSGISSDSKISGLFFRNAVTWTDV